VVGLEWYLCCRLKPATRLCTEIHLAQERDKGGGIFFINSLINPPVT